MSAIENIREKFDTGEFCHKKASDIFRLLGVSGKTERENILRLLKELESAGEIVRDDRGRYVLPSELRLVRGTLQGNERGFAFLVREEGEDLFLPHRSLHGALHGDTVLCRVVGGDRGDEAEVYSILRRGMPRLTGTYYRDRKCGMVEADERRFSRPVRVIGGLRAFSGEKVVVDIVNYPEGKDPEGEICEVLGRGGDLSVEENAIIRSQNLSEEFPQKVLAFFGRIWYYISALRTDLDVWSVPPAAVGPAEERFGGNELNDNRRKKLLWQVSYP